MPKYLVGRPNDLVGIRTLAVRLQKRLQRRGYACSQYQGVIETDAPHDLIRVLHQDILINIGGTYPPK